ncbi:DUF4465 domain-containing protein [Xylanibacter muris]|uniref:DUF4465 domain-containing protein n=1 Tax=Xylanibacter muris TaxID=2736290 RepID=A0ABX2AKE9_9BACT|nr:DUF4465 domain-containing protein [Xylanibacter muris]NPD91666.1 DUF4465 domain-containing protein [Xylanibacter muris]
MVQKFIYQLSAIIVMLLCVSPSARAQQEGNVVTQLQFGKQVITVPTGQELTFYDPKGTGPISSSSSNNTHSLTVFKPEEEGMAVQVCFEQIDVRNDGASYPGEVRAYSGNPDADDSFEWATGVYGAFNTLPEGNVIKTYDGEYSHDSIYSTSPDGILSVGMLWRYAKRCEGWVAKVKAIKLTEMEVTGGGTDYSVVSASPSAKTNVPFAAFYLDAAGITSPDRLTSVRFKMTKNAAGIDPLSLRLYSGNVITKDSQPLDAVVAADGDGWHITLDHILSQGKNMFVIAGDFPLDAPVSASVEIEVTGLTTSAMPDGVTPFSGTDPVAVLNPAIVMIAEGETTATVGDTPLAFYDDGGVDGQITKGFKGIITFVPEKPGKKVMIDIKSLKLYEGSVYYQYLNIYNGKEAVPENLVKRMKNGSTAIVHSSSEDGALTVELSHNGLTGFTADGFEATVSLFEPQPMTLDSIFVSQVTEGTVCAGDTGQPILRLNLRTYDTEPVLTATKFRFTTNNTFDVITGAALYYGRADDRFSAMIRVGEAEVNGDVFEITVSEPVALVEGENHFMLVYDIDNMAVNGKKIDAALVSVVAGGETFTPALGNPDGDRTVENTVYSHAGQGTVTKSVNGSLAFRTQPKGEYSSDYEAGTDDRINTFVPMHDGMMCQMDITKFDLYYGSSSYQPKAKFRVYSGQGTDGELLWELSSADHKTTGPERILRSTSSDGAITVVFNPNESATYYTAKGFEAVVSEYKSQPMALDTVIVAQTSTDIVSPGMKDQALLTVNVVTAGDIDPLALDRMKLGLKGLQGNISRLSLYAVGAKDMEPVVGATPVATVAVTEETAEAVLVPEQCKLREGSNYFRITADVSDGAESEGLVDASVISLCLSGNENDIAGGDPDGTRTVKDVYVMHAGDNGEIVVKPGRKILFYDNGGASGSASKGFEGKVTFAPGAEGDVIKLVYNNIKLGYSDHLYIYDGTVAEGVGPVKDYSGSNIQDREYVSGAADGKVTVRFVVKSSYSLPDFEMEVSSYRRKAKEIAAVKVDTVAPAGVLRGQQDVPMLRVAMTVEGDYDTVSVVRFTACSKDVKAVKVFYTGTADVFAPTCLYGVCDSPSEGQVDIAGKTFITENGIHYFWLAYDVDASAEIGSRPAVSLGSITAGDNTVTIENANAGATVREGVHGIITVGAGADFGTVQGAVDHIAEGIDGPVVINIMRGIYNERVNVPDIPGTSAINTIIIQSESGYSDVKIYHNSYDEPDYSDDKMFHEYGVFTISGADYLTLRGIELTTADIKYPSVVHVKNVSRHVTVDSCYVHAEMTTSYSDDINLIYTYAKSEPNANNDYLTVRNSLLEGGYVGVRFTGTSTLSLPKQVGGIVENCVFRNQGSKSIYAYDELGIRIADNIFENNASDASTCYGIDLNVREEYRESTVIENNRFNFAAAKAAIPVYIRGIKASASVPGLIKNNEIVLNSTARSSAGIEFSGPSSNVNIAHNTVRVSGMSSNAVLWFNDDMGEGVSVVNNILQNESHSPVYRFYRATNIPTVSFSNNMLFTNGTVFAYAQDDIATFDDWKQTSSSDAGSYNDSTVFLSNVILEPAAEGNLLNAIPLAYVAEDIDGTRRSSTAPTIGAYEYNPDAATAVPVPEDGFPFVGNITDSTAVVYVKACLNGKAYVTVRDADVPVPAKDEVLDASAALNIRKNKVASAVADTLTKDREYVAYVVLESLYGITSDVIATDRFTANGEPVIEIPSVIVDAEGSTVAKGEAAVFTVTVLGGTAPFDIRWIDGKHNEIATDEIVMLGTSALEYIPTECDDYYVTVTDANGKQATDTCRVILTGEAVSATFENLWLAPESSWSGPHTKGNVVSGLYGDEMHGSFVSGSYSFSNVYNLSYGSWSGFAYSNSTSSDFITMKDQYNSVTGKGFDGSDNYCVAFTSGTIGILNAEDGDELRGCYVTNSAYTLHTILNGDSYARKFETGDWLKVVFTGKHADGTESSVEYYLADYRSDNIAEHTYANKWEWVDLSPLGKVVSVSFTLDGSDASAWGLNTPAYFCMDSFNGVSPQIPDGIGSVSGSNGDGDVREIARHTLDGRPLASPVPGVNIVKMSDGTTIKVVVK